MFLDSIDITASSRPTDIVRLDYRTAAVFSAHGIEYCCGAQWPLNTVCEMKGLDADLLLQELKDACRTVQVPVHVRFMEWNTDFLVDYIIHIHHHYLRQTLPSLENDLDKFTHEHRKRYPYFDQVLDQFRQLKTGMLHHITQEEDNIFPYLRQVAHAYAENGTDSFAGLLVRTLRKPLKRLVENEHRILEESIYNFRRLTAKYEPPVNACPAHRVILARLRELDNDLVQHFYLENQVLIPRVIEMEKELLGGSA